MQPRIRQIVCDSTKQHAMSGVKAQYRDQRIEEPEEPKINSRCQGCSTGRTQTRGDDMRLSEFEAFVALVGMRLC